ncbi:MAG: hypothetical protein QM765_30460 [Myxococcales bacterium]
MRLVIVLAALSLGAGCSLFCPPPMDCVSNGAVVVRVVDADTQAPLGNVTVLASSGGGTSTEVPRCPDYLTDGDVDAGPSNCRWIREPGKYHLVIRALGYAEATLDVESERDVCGDLTSQVRDVRLQKLGSAAQPMVNASEACGG